MIPICIVIPMEFSKLGYRAEITDLTAKINLEYVADARDIGIDKMYFMDNIIFVNNDSIKVSFMSSTIYRGGNLYID